MTKLARVNASTNPDIVTSSQLAGWDRLAARSGKTSSFQVWENNDKMTNALGAKVAV